MVPVGGGAGTGPGSCNRNRSPVFAPESDHHPTGAVHGGQRSPRRSRTFRGRKFSFAVTWRKDEREGFKDYQESKN